MLLFKKSVEILFKNPFSRSVSTKFGFLSEVIRTFSKEVAIVSEILFVKRIVYPILLELSITTKTYL